MRPVVFFCCFVCVACLLESQQTHACTLPSKSFQQASSKTISSFSYVVTKSFGSSQPGQTSPDDESLLAVEDDDDDQELIGKQALVIKPNSVISTLSALPPPECVSLPCNSSPESSLRFRSGRYLVHRALLI